MENRYSAGIQTANHLNRICRARVRCTLHETWKPASHTARDRTRRCPLSSGITLTNMLSTWCCQPPRSLSGPLCSLLSWLRFDCRCKASRAHTPGRGQLFQKSYGWRVFEACTKDSCPIHWESCRPKCAFEDTLRIFSMLLCELASVGHCSLLLLLNPLTLLAQIRHCV